MGPLLLLACGAWAQTYDIRDLGTLGGGSSRAYGINEQGWVVGESETTSGLVCAFLWTAPQGMTNLGTLGGETSRAYAINERGQVIGEAETADGRMLAFQWTPGGGMTNLPLPEGARESYAYGNNNYGMIAGACDVGEGTRAVVWSVDGPAMPALLADHGSSIAYDVNDFGDLVGQAEVGDPGAFVSRAFFLGATGLHVSLSLATQEWSSAALAVNVEGLATGYAEREGATHAALLNPTNSWHDVDTLDSVYSVGYGVNQHGQAVGLFVSSHEDEDRAFVTENGRMIDLNERVESNDAWLLAEARALNDTGQIVGYGLRDGHDRAFLLTPRPGSATVDTARVSIRQPARGTRVREGAPVNLEAEISGVEAVHRVTYAANGVVLGSVTGAPYLLRWEKPAAGSYDLVATASDRQGRIRRSPRVRMDVLMKSQALTVLLLEPDDGTALALGSNITVHAEAGVLDGVEAKVIVRADGQDLIAVTGTSARLEWRPAATGLYTVIAVAQSEDEDSATSLPVRIHVTEEP